MLSQGRTAERIAEELYVSKSTSRSHIYRIYQKTNIHSQQDLIDLVEKAYKKEQGRYDALE